MRDTGSQIKDYFDDIVVRLDAADILDPTHPVAQPFVPPAPPEPFADLANVVSLAELDNVTIKISGACTLSHVPFPYPDIWEPLGKIFDAFGFDRCLWGTDWTRAVRLLNFEQGVEAFRVTDQLSDSERSALMGGTLANIYNWAPTAGR